jgi:hypothetical protein
VEEQAATISKALNHIQNVSFLKVKPAIRQAQNKFSLILSILSLILKMAAAKWLALVCLLCSDHKEASCRIICYILQLSAGQQKLFV